MKKFTTAEIRDLLNGVMFGEISLSRMVEVINERVDQSEVREFKDGDFVYEDGRIMIVKSYPNIHHANAWPIYSDTLSYNGTYAVDFSEPTFRYATAEEKQELIELLRKDGKQWNADKKRIEDIPKRRFKKGDKVKIKHGVSNKTHYNVAPAFVEDMDDLIGKTMTVYRYTDGGEYVACEETEYSFREEWLEPYEELKKGDLAIFWDDCGGDYATIRLYGEKDNRFHFDSHGMLWDNAIKFESKEQFEKILRGEI